LAEEWEVECTDQFDAWFESLSPDDKDALGVRVDKLAEVGPSLGRPLVDSVTTSRHSNMKELRYRSLRVLFAFDPRQTAILLLGGDKSDRWSEWYREAVPEADELYDVYLNEVREEGLL
jgi:hypothetical protein